MTKKRSAKNAFISSLVILCLCVTMLVGTTFAWYTDSVTSGRNTIVAGSLDIVLEVYDGPATGTYAETFGVAGNWTTVGPTTKIFDEGTANQISFEPGAAQVAYVRVKNNGDLAFKYSLAAVIDTETPGTNQAGQSFKLSDYLYFGQATITAAGPYTDRADAVDALGSTPELLKNSQLSANGAYLEKETTSDVIALVIYMPETTGNEANPLPNAKPRITFGLNALATQYAKESDGFSDQYDANADGSPDHTDWAIARSASGTATVANNEATTISAGVAPASGAVSTTVEFENGALDNGAAVLTVETNNAIAASNEFEISGGDTPVASLDLNLTVAGNDVTEFNNTAATVRTYIAKGLSNVSIKYDDGTTTETWNATAADESGVTGHVAYYDATTGLLVFETTHFSEYVVYSNMQAYIAETDKAYGTFSAAVEAATANDTVYLLKDIDLVNEFGFTKSVTINGNGHSVRASAATGAYGSNREGRVFDISDVSDLTVKLVDIRIIGESSGVRGISLYGTTNLNLILDGCDITANYYAINIASENTGLTVSVKNNTMSTGWCAIQSWSPNAQITIENSKLIGINDKTYNADGYNDFSTIVINNKATDNVWTIKNCIIEASQTTGNNQTAFSFRSARTVINSINNVYKYNNEVKDIVADFWPTLTTFTTMDAINTLQFYADGELIDLN